MASPLATVFSPGGQGLMALIPGVLSWLEARKNQPQPYTTARLGGIDMNAMRSNRPFSVAAESARRTGQFGPETFRGRSAIPGMDTFARFNPTGNILPSGPPDPQAISEGLASDLGRAFEAATTERDRALSFGRKAQAGFEKISEQGQDRLDEFRALREGADERFAPSRQAANAIFRDVMLTSRQSFEAANRAASNAMALYEQTKQMAADAKATLGMEIASHMDAFRSGVESAIEERKIEVSTRLAQSGASQDEIDAAMTGIDFEKGTVLMAQVGSIAKEQAAIMKDQLVSLTNVVSQAGQAAARTVAEVATAAGATGAAFAQSKIAAGELIRSVDDMDATFRLNAMTAEATYANTLAAVESQNHAFLANFMASVKEPVMMTASGFLMPILSIWQTLAGEENAAQAVTLQAVLAQAGLLNASVAGASNAYNQRLSAEPPPQPSWFESMLPGLGSAAGTALGGPLGGAIGGSLGSMFGSPGGGYRSVPRGAGMSG